MAESQPDRGAAVRHPPPLIFLSVILLAYGLDYLVPAAISPSRLLLFIGAILILVALGIVATVFFAFRQVKTHIEPWKPTSTIVINGVFAYSRNPIYSSFCLATIGVGLILNSWWVVGSFIPLAILLYYLVIRREEAYLADSFGDQYLAYRQRVRRWL